MTVMETREQQRLAALASYDVLDTPREKDFDDIAALAAAICETPIAVVNLIGDRRQFFKAEVGLGVRETPFDSSFCAKAILEEEFMLVPDATRDSRFECNPLVTGEPHLRFYAGALLKTADGFPIGTMCVLDYRPRDLTEVQQQTLRVLARQVMTQLDLRQTLKAERENAAATVATLAANDERSRIAQAAARIGTFELDIGSGDMTVSAEFCRIFGVPESETAHAATFEGLVVADDSGVRSSDPTRRDASAPLNVEYRIRRANDGAVRWVARNAAFVDGGDGRPQRMFGAVQDITARRLSVDRSDALLALGDQLRDAATTVEVAGTVAAVVGSALNCQRAGYVLVDPVAAYANFEGEWLRPGERSIAGRHPLSALDATIGQLSTGEMLAISDTQADDSLGGDASRYAVINTRAVLIAPQVERGRLVGMLFAHDSRPRVWTREERAFVRGVADRAYAAVGKARAEADQTLLNEELSHRLKNTLAMVQAIALQTLRGAGDPAALEAFNQRVQALGNAHDILLQRNWAAAEIGEVIDGILTNHGAAARVDAMGPNLTLQPRIALSLSLILHELLTNAAKYGALSNDAGRIALTWRIEPDTVPRFVMDWVERDGPPASEPDRRGFGTRLIRTGLAGTGGVNKRYPASGFEAEFTVPLAALQQSD